MRALSAIALIVALCLSSGAFASEEDFLQSIEGQWTGGGKVLTKLGGGKVDVSCSMKSDADRSSFSMNGTCSALVVVKRTFTATVKASGASYSGNYVGVSGKPSKLNGSREGNTLNLDVTWANEIYGDRQARMTIEKIGGGGLRIRTLDQDPESGETIVTTQLDLQRR
ncbi:MULTISPECIES: hypothetical protein [Rhizobium/Agrobacterium group]|uniref:Uncharacterized protein n=2 Tax=Neorhizobium TaxID=1525371 RepID=A0ABV0M440_9HYPH|nr:MULTISPECIES: hypothetical protein [Rhizobium/Agrobacterium group]KGE02402.1 hypothetical protein JL39_02430 [Rhizobium sp. YS-1r]MCC2613549.1 hypothetical protein [Neorhizobium petrolearium]WGI71867.1 hypothetical protein QEO92_27355 [Neorhizobium petrolearium]